MKWFSLISVLILGAGTGCSPMVNGPDFDMDGDGFTKAGGDCNDNDPEIHPNADEHCDDVDWNCDGSPHLDAVDAGFWFPDNDLDGFGSIEDGEQACVPPKGYIAIGNDCDDDDPEIHPAATEWCDGVDQDCDGLIDDNPVDGTFGFIDADLDGYGDISTGKLYCEVPENAVLIGGDCNDAHPEIHPGAKEYCDDVDWDCDGEAFDADGVDAYVFYADADHDGFGAGPEIRSCIEVHGHAVIDGDCDDMDDEVYPGSHFPEVPNDGIDQDCDGNDYCDDLNCDGWPDLIFTGYRSSGSNYTAQSYIYYGSATWHAPEVYSYTDHAVAKAIVEDLNLDGYPDVVTVPYGNNNYTRNLESTVLWGSAEGPSMADTTELPVYGAMDACAGDLDADGHTDLVYANASSVDSYIYWGGGSGFSASNRSKLSADINPKKCHIEDLDQDGSQDITLVGVFGTTYVYWGQSGSFSTASRDSFAHGRTEASAFQDVNGDGYTDMLIGGVNTSELRIWYGSSSGFSSVYDALDSNGIMGIGVADLDSDGHEDVVLCNWVPKGGDTWHGSDKNTEGHVYYGSATGFSAADRLELPNFGCRSLTLADADADGDIDLLFGSTGQDTGSSYTYHGEAVLYYNDSGSFSVAQSVGFPTLRNLGNDIQDLNLDGYPDVILGNYSSNTTPVVNSQIYWGKRTGFDVSRSTALPTQGTWQSPTVVGAE